MFLRIPEMRFYHRQNAAMFGIFFPQQIICSLFVDASYLRRSAVICRYPFNRVLLTNATSQRIHARNASMPKESLIGLLKRKMPKEGVSERR
jgi:hypothetical protein